MRFRDQGALAAYLRSHGVTRLPWLNRGVHMPVDFSARQRARIQKLYAGDFALVEQVQRGRTATERELLRAMGVAAE